jgi:hypothetical protein
MNEPHYHRRFKSLRRMYERSEAITREVHFSIGLHLAGAAM